MAKTTRTVEIPIDRHETFVSIAKSFASSENVAEKLRNLYNLQQTDLEIDALMELRGQLPEEVASLRREVEALGAKSASCSEIIAAYEHNILTHRASIDELGAQRAKYQAQLDEIQNNREFDSLSKEIENVEFSILVAEKKIKELKAAIAEKNAEIEQIAELLETKKADLAAREEQLARIVDSTSKDEQRLMQTRNGIVEALDPRTIKAYESIRSINKNHLAVVTVYNNRSAKDVAVRKTRTSKDAEVSSAVQSRVDETAACGGCFHTIPPQKLIDIRENKKMIICEYCGRILVSAE